MKIHRETLWLWRSLALVGCSLPTSACVDALVGEVDVCELNGKGYTLNEKFGASDGCNTCTCQIDGDVACTELSCADSGVVCDEDAGCEDAGSDPSCTKGGCSLDSGVYAPPSMNPNCEKVRICPDAGVGKPSIACYYTCADAGLPAPVCDPKLGCPDAGIGLRTCEYLGKTYTIGESFRDPEACGGGLSTCTCGYSGVQCNDVVCYEPDASVAPGTCDYAGTLYKPGEWFTASDNCSKCQCLDTSVVECFRDPCNADAGPGFPVDSSVYDPGKGSCNYLGKTYRVGEGFGKGDNCNKCLCAADGLIECSSNSCAATGCVFGDSKLVSFGQSVTCEDGCNTCTCDAKGGFTRTERACPAVPFVASCGAAMDPLAFPAPLVYVNGSSLGVSASRCVNGQSSDFSLCFDLNATSYEASLYVVPSGVTHACGATERVFNLSLVAEAYRSATGQMMGKLLLRGNGEGLGYSF